MSENMYAWVYDLSRVLYQSRPWHRREQQASRMHPAVIDMVRMYQPHRWHLLVLEWPHASQSDPTKMAYTRSEEHGLSDRQTITSVGKYLTRHFPDAPSDKIRDIAGKYGNSSFKVTTSMSEMQAAVRDGPESCMSKFHLGERHPYSVYDPALGWGMALRIDGSKTVTGRALVWHDPDNADNKRFVRTYSKDLNGNGYSQADGGLKQWLLDTEYKHVDGWDGALLRHIPHHKNDDNILAPYIDGDDRAVSVDCRNNTLFFESHGDYLCDDTDGHAARHNGINCECCGDRIAEDESYSVNYHGDYQVCCSCLTDYVYVYGRGGDEYYIPQDEAVYVESEDQYYDPEYLSRHNIIQLDNGHYENADNAVHLDSRDIWVHSDDEDAVYCEQSSLHEHIDDCVRLANDYRALADDAWQCEHDESWYLSEDNAPVEVTTANGHTLMVHEDHADHYAEETN